MTEWLYEDGIGEARALLIAGGHALAARIEREGALRVGTVLRGRLGPPLGSGALVTLDDGGEALLPAGPEGVSEGAAIMVEVTREGYAEPGGRIKRARVRLAGDAAEPRAGASLCERIDAGPHPVRRLSPHEPDLFEDYGWSEICDAARTGETAFDGGTLLIAPTPAMTLIDIDGALPPADLARAGAVAAAEAIRLFGIGGSIGVDFPSLAEKSARTAVADAFDGAMHGPFERTAINGFGFMQVVRKRLRPSLVETMQGDPVLAAALALLRRAGREEGAGAARLVCHPALASRIEAGGWIGALERRIGRSVTIEARGGTDLHGGFLEPRKA